MLGPLGQQRGSQAHGRRTCCHQGGVVLSERHAAQAAIRDAAIGADRLRSRPVRHDAAHGLAPLHDEHFAPREAQRERVRGGQERRAVHILHIMPAERQLEGRPARVRRRLAALRWRLLCPQLAVLPSPRHKLSRFRFVQKRVPQCAIHLHRSVARSVVVIAPDLPAHCLVGTLSRPGHHHMTGAAPA